MAKAPTLAATSKGYQNMYDTMKFTRSSAINNTATKIIQNKDKYLAVQNKTGVPWYWIGAIHMRESSNDFRGVLHNGEKTIGTGRKTVLVPKGRGPFSTWEEAAIDALQLKGLQKISDWSIPRMLYEAERYNGWGYTWRKVNSPYVWGGTNHQQLGKYVADGVWSSTAKDTQLGVAPVIYRIRELEGIKNDERKDSGSVGNNGTVTSVDSSNNEHTDETSWFIKLLRLLFTKK